MRQVGAYEVHEELARGGQGVVYRARDPRLGRDVVLKLLLVDDPDSRRRLEREARALAQLRHPHLVPLHALGEHQGKPFLVLPYLSGDSLQDRLDRGGPLPVEEALRFAREVGEALTAAHAAGLLHRDLKPANVLTDERGRALLTDFGLVKRVGPGQSQTLSLSVRGRCLGTPGYWAPEQAQGRHEEAGPAADVYGLGALLYACLSGVPPRPAANLLEAYEASQAPLQPLRVFRDDVPAWVDALLRACLEVDAGRRPPLAAVLRSLEEGGVELPARRGTSRAVVAGSALALVVGAGLWAVWSASAEAAAALPRQPRPGAAPDQTSPEEGRQVEPSSLAELDDPDLGAQARAELLLERAARASAGEASLDYRLELTRRIRAEMDEDHPHPLRTRLYVAGWTLGNALGPALLRRFREQLPPFEEDWVYEQSPGITAVAGEGSAKWVLLGQGLANRVRTDQGDPVRLRPQAAHCMFRALDAGEPQAYADLTNLISSWLTEDEVECRLLVRAVKREGLERGVLHCAVSLAYEHLVLSDEFPAELEVVASLLEGVELDDEAYTLFDHQRVKLGCCLVRLARRDPPATGVPLDAAIEWLEQSLRTLPSERGGYLDMAERVLRER